MLRKSDLLWLLLYPLYQTLGTIRHEACHALVIVLSGGHLMRFVVVPGWNPEVGGFYWGYVQSLGYPTWWTSAAPFLCDVLTVSLFFALCVRRPFKHHWLWINLVILGIIHPLTNSAYAYLKALTFATGDVLILMQTFPHVPVHAYFLLTIALYVAALAIVLRTPRPVAGKVGGE